MDGFGESSLVESRLAGYIITRAVDGGWTFI